MPQPSKSQAFPTKIVVLADSPDVADHKAHLYPIIDFLLAHGHRYNPTTDSLNPRAFYKDKTGEVFGVAERIDWNSLLTHFEFPASIQVEPKLGTIQDTRRSLMIHEGLNPMPASHEPGSRTCTE
jgi:hypothetical protein